MHLFSTHGCHIVHWDPGIAIVFPEFLSTSIYSCGTVGFGVFILFWFLSPGFSLCPFCMEATLVFLIFMIRTQSSLSRSTPLVPNITDMAVVYGLRCADWQTFSGLQYCSCERSALWVKCSTKLSVAAIEHLDNLVLKLFFFTPAPHMHPRCIIKSR